MKAKGMSMAMQLLITAIVLVVTAITILLIVQGKILGGTNQAQETGDRNLCYTNRQLYCQDHALGCWNSSKAVVKEQTCEKLLERPEKRILYNCEEQKWYNETEFLQIVRGDLEVTCGAQET